MSSNKTMSFKKAYGKSMPKAARVEFSLTPQAQEIWNAIPGDFQMKLLNNVWCRTCSDTTGIGSLSGKVEKGSLKERIMSFEF